MSSLPGWFGIWVSGILQRNLPLWICFGPHRVCVSRMYPIPHEVFAEEFFWGICVSLAGFGMALPARCEYRIAMLDDSLPRLDAQLVEGLATRLKGEGYEIIRITADELCDPATITPDRFDMLHLPAAAALPVAGMKPVEDFIHQGGDLIALQSPAFTEPLWKPGREWLTVTEWRERLNRVPADHLLFDYENGNLGGWIRNSNTPNPPASWRLGAGQNGQALHVSIENMAGWDTMASPVLDTPFPDGHTLTCLYAKGAGKTNALSLEWLEKDGSRWIGVFRVATAPTSSRIMESSIPTARTARP